MLYLLVIAFLPSSKHLLISWLQSPSAVILEPKKIKFVTISIVSPSICHEVMGLDAKILVFVGLHQFSCSVMSDSVRPHGWTAALQASLFFTISQSLLKLMSIKSLMPSNHLILWHPLLLLPSIFPSIRFFFNESALHIRWPKYWSFGFGISPSKEYSGLISFWMDWFVLSAIQGTLRSLLQQHSLKASILWRSAFFMV